jgi:hypothetical protein
MSGNGAWYGGDDQQPASRNPAQPGYLDEPHPSHSFAEAPTAEQPLVPRPRVAADDGSGPVPLPPPAPPPALPRIPHTPQPGEPPGDLPAPFPASMYDEDGDVADPDATTTTPIPKIGAGPATSVQLSTIELTTDAAGAADAQLNAATETSAPPARNRRDLSAGIAIALVILMVLCIGVAGSSLQVLTQGTDTFETNTCVAPERESRLPYRQVDCSDPAGTHMVVGVLGRDSDRPCRGVPGASTLFSTNATVVCLGRKGVDGSRSINIVQVGDCVNIDGGTAALVDCRDASARFQVIKRLTDVPEGTSGPCAGIEGLIETFQWNWKSDDPVDRSEKSVDVVLCLGQSQSAINAAAAARAAQSTCRFLTDAEVSAAVSAATSKTYTVSERVDDGTHCNYQFSRPNEIVRVGFFSGAKLNPERGSENFTVDGLRAAWDPGRGDRSLGVEVPTGTMYIKVQLAGVGDVTSRKLAIDTFKSARSRIR